MGATTVEIPASHVAMVSHPGEVAQLIKTAAEAASAATQTGSPAHRLTRAGLAGQAANRHLSNPRPGAHNSESGNTDLSDPCSADHRDGGQGHPARPEPINLWSPIEATFISGRHDAVLVDPAHDGRAGHGCS